MPSRCYVFLLSILAVFIISHYKLVEGYIIKIPVVTINNGSLNIICNLKRNQKENKSLISWRKDDMLLPRDQYTFGEDQAFLNITNATVQDTGFYYLAFNSSLNNSCERNIINENCSCKRDVRINITGCATNVSYNSVDLRTMNCTFKDSICRFQNWMLLLWKSNKPPPEKHRISCERKENDVLHCQAHNTELFLQDMALWQLRAYNETHYSDLHFRFDNHKYVTFDEKPEIQVKVSNLSALLTFTLKEETYYEVVHKSSNFIFKISIKEPWGSKEFLSEKQYQFDTCPNTTYSVSAAYRLKDTKLPHIWSESNTVTFRTKPEVPLPVPQATDGCFKRLDSKSYRIFWKKVERCYNAQGFVYLLKCGEKVLNKTRHHSFVVEDYHNQCQGHPIQIFTATQSEISKEFTSIYIPKKVLPVNQSLFNVFYKKSETKYHYEISSLSLQEVDLSNYTIFYCKKTQYYDDYCAESGIGWLTLSGGTRSFELNISDQESPKPYRIAVSIQNGFTTSGLKWINCVIPLKIEGDQSVEDVKQVRRGTNWILIRWHFPCEKRSKEVEGFVVSWSSEDSGTTQNSSILDWQEEDYKISGLNKATNYSVTVETKLKGNQKSYAVTQYFMTTADDPPILELWLTIFLAFVIAIFIGIAIRIVIKKYKNIQKNMIVIIPSGLIRNNSTQSNRSNGPQQTVILYLKESMTDTMKKESTAVSNESLNNSHEFLVGINPSDFSSLPLDAPDTSLFDVQVTNLGHSEDDLSINNSMYDSSISNYKETVEASPVRNDYLGFGMEFDLDTENFKNDFNSSFPQMSSGTSAVNNGYVRCDINSQDGSSSNSLQMPLETSPVVNGYVRFATESQDDSSINNLMNNSSSKSLEMPLGTSPVTSNYVQFAMESQDDSSITNSKLDFSSNSPQIPLEISAVSNGYVRFAIDSQNDSPIRDSKHDSYSNSPPVTLGTSPVTDGYVRFAAESQDDSSIRDSKHDSSSNSPKMTSSETNNYVRCGLDHEHPSEVEFKDENELTDNSKDTVIYAQIVAFSVGAPAMGSSAPTITQDMVAYPQKTVA